MISPAHCAKDILDTVPAIMQAIRWEMRSQRQPGISVPQFRTMAFTLFHPGASLSEAAEHVGLTLSAMSKLVDALVEKGLVLRETSKDDRRRLVLQLSPEGRAMLLTMRKAAQGHLAKTLEKLTETERASVEQAMRILAGAFGLECAISDSEK